MTPLEYCAQQQTECGDYIRRGGPDIEGAKRGAGDWLMEEALIRTEYTDFLKSKRNVMQSCGPTVESNDIHMILFPFQRDLTRWAIRKGRAAIFADTGLGKTFMQLEWGRLVTKKNVLIVAPLSVGRQTIREAAKIEMEVRYSRSGPAGRFTITNYEMLEKFNAADFGAVVLDESSILKSLDGKTRKKLTEMFSGTPYRLCCTATPAPNDIAELANHAEFLGIMSRADMLASFFIHDDEGWRLKGHAAQPFYRWLASWGMSIRKPSDLGYDDDGYTLPSLSVEPIFVDSEVQPEGRLFFMGLKGIGDRSKVRRQTIDDRVQAVLELATGDDDQWILWHGLNEEGKALESSLDDAVLVEGSQDAEEKASAIESFQDGDFRILITKPRIAGFGMNFQNCHKMAFVGLSDSWEAYYQCIRRCYRFGQQNPVQVYIVLSDQERTIYENVMNKERQAKTMAANLIEHVREFEREEIGDGSQDWQYRQAEASGDRWTAKLGDSCERLREVESESVGLSIFSPPFMSLYTYSPSERDLGNSSNREQFWNHFRFIIEELLRVTKPGRNCCVHVSQLPTTAVTHGVIGLHDFRGDVICGFQNRGWVYHGEVCIDKDPQAQAIRTHSKGLLFVQLRKDASWLRPGLADYILIFRKPGDNIESIHPDITNDDWIEWARPVWYGIKETETLNVAAGRDNSDERHICPLQLGTIERCIRLWSNEGDLVLSPFMGIGSEGYVALKQRRRFVGIELKESYYRTAIANLRAAENAQQINLFTATSCDAGSEEAQPGAASPRP